MDYNKTQHLFIGADRGIVHEKDGQRRCMGCMELYSMEFELCPHCGYQLDTEVENALHMYPGTVLNDKYVVGKVLGYGGFGVTYLAWDTILQTKVAIKEYLPSEFSTRSAGQTRITVFSGEKSKQFSDGMDKFIDEAKRLALFRSEAGIVKIFDSFEENGTAYIAMEYLEGETLAEYLEKEKTVSVEEAVQMLMPVIESLNKVHDEGIIHRDIAPDNIFLTNKGEVKLIDFGASRYATTSRSRSLTVIIKPGYSAEEQYRSRGDQGSHTDVYSIGAALYRMITGHTPPDAMERRAQYEKNRKDILVPITKYTKEISKNYANAIYNAMNVRIEDRTPDMISLAGELMSEEPVKRRRSGLKKIDPLTWPLWAKIGVPSGIVVTVTLCVLLAFGIIGPKSTLRTDFYVPDGQTLVPDIIADELENAQKTLEKNNLQWRIADRKENAVIPKDLVLLQDPDAFNTVDMGSFIDIIISDGFGRNFVADVTGKTLEEAKVILEELGFVVVTEEEESNTVAPGSVILQSVEPETELEKRSEIVLTVSTGTADIDTSKIVNVPDLSGMRYEDAVAELEKYNLYYSKKEIYNETLPLNQVIGQNPAPKTSVNAGDTVTITVNMGIQKINISSYEGKNAETVRQELEANGLNVKIQTEQNKNFKEGTVIRNDPNTGSLKSGSTVTLVISEGYTTTVPNVEGLKLKDAQELLMEHDLASNIVGKEASSTVPEGRVISQDIKANETAEIGTTVNLIISTGSGKSEETEPENIVLSSITLTQKPTKTKYYVGDKFDSSGMKVTAKYSDGTTKDITDTVNISGFDSSVGGSCTVKVSYSESGVTKNASFTVTIQGIKVLISPSSLSLVEGQSGKITATTEPGGCAVTWSSNNTNVAMVSNGNVTAVKEGNAVITAMVSRGSETSKMTCSVSVSKNVIEVTGITINKNNASMKVGDTLTLTATLEPVNATNKNLKWSSSNADIATVSASGVVTAKKAGSTKITVATEDGKKSATCSVSVEKVTLSSILVKEPSKTSYYVGDTLNTAGMTVTANYSDGNSKLITSGYTCSPINLSSAGTQKITVSYTESGITKTAEFNVSVVEKKYTLTVNKGTGISSVSGGNSYTSGDSITVTATVSSGYAFDKWTVSGTNKVSGSTNITYTFTMPGCNLTLTASAVPVTLSSISVKTNPSKTSYYVGETLNTSGMVVQAKYNDGTTKDITGYTCSPTNLSVAGTQRITVSYTESGITKAAEFIVSIIEKKYMVTLSKGTGISSISGGSSYAPGDKVTVKATVSSGYSFCKWTSSNTNLVSDYTSSSYTFTMPSGNVTLTASATKDKVYATSLSLSSNSGTMHKKATGITASSVNATVGYEVSNPSVTVNYDTVDKITLTAMVNSDAEDKSVSVSVSEPKATTSGELINNFNLAEIDISTSRNDNKTKITIEVVQWPSIDVSYDIIISANGASSSLEKIYTLTIKGIALNSVNHVVVSMTPNDSKIISYNDGLYAVDNGTSTVTVKTFGGFTTTAKVYIDCPDYYDVSTSSVGKYIRSGPGQNYSYDLYTDISPGARVYIDDVYYNTSEKRVYGKMKYSYTDPDDGSVASAGWFEMYYLG